MYLTLSFSSIIHAWILLNKTGPSRNFGKNRAPRQALAWDRHWGYLYLGEGGVTDSHGPWENSELVGHLTVENTEFVVAQKLFRKSGWTNAVDTGACNHTLKVVSDKDLVETV